MKSTGFSWPRFLVALLTVTLLFGIGLYRLEIDTRVVELLPQKDPAISDALYILKNHPELLGVSVDEGTAMIVTGNTFEVLGPRYVIVYDRNFWSREGWDKKTLPEENQRFYFLRQGDKYDMLNRKVID